MNPIRTTFLFKRLDRSASSKMVASNIFNLIWAEIRNNAPWRSVQYCWILTYSEAKKVARTVIVTSVPLSAIRDNTFSEHTLFKNMTLLFPLIGRHIPNQFVGFYVAKSSWTVERLEKNTLPMCYDNVPEIENGDAGLWDLSLLFKTLLARRRRDRV